MNDRGQRLQQLAAENAQWADEQLRLIETIRKNKQQLERLPGIIKRLNKQLEHATAEMERTGQEHDVLEDDAKLMAWANDQADDYADFLLTTQPSRPDPFGLFEEPE